MTVRVETGKWARWRLVSAVSSRRLSSMAAATSPARCSRWIAANVTRVEPERDGPDVRCRAARPDEVIVKGPTPLESVVRPAPTWTLAARGPTDVRSPRDDARTRMPGASLMLNPIPKALPQPGRRGHVLRHLLRESVALVRHTMPFPVDVRPSAPCGAQKAPGCTPWSTGLAGGGGGGGGGRGAGGAGAAGGAGGAGAGARVAAGPGTGGTLIGTRTVAAAPPPTAPETAFAGEEVDEGVTVGGREVVVDVDAVVEMGGVVTPVEAAVVDVVEATILAAIGIDAGAGAASAAPATRPIVAAPRARPACRRRPRKAHLTRARRSPTMATTAAYREAKMTPPLKPVVSPPSRTRSTSPPHPTACLHPCTECTMTGPMGAGGGPSPRTNAGGGAGSHIRGAAAAAESDGVVRQNSHPSGGAGHEASGSQPSCGTQSMGGEGQPGGGQKKSGSGPRALVVTRGEDT